MSDDIIDEAQRRLIELLPNTPDDVVRRFGEGLRDAWGGTTAYICKAPAEKKTMRLAAGLAAGQGLWEVMEVAGCSRAWAYRLLARQWRRR